MRKIILFLFLPIFSFTQIGYNPVSQKQWYKDTIQFSKPFRVTTGAGSGKVLTSSSDGVMTLQNVVGITGATGATGTFSSTGATGDILYWSATNTTAHRTIGTTGQLLYVSGGVPTWASVTQTAYSILVGYAGNTATASATRYSGFGGQPISSIRVTQRIYVACTISNFSITTSSSQPASGSLVVSISKNNVVTVVTFTIAASGAAGNYSDDTHSVSFAAGDYIGITYVNSATAASATVQGQSCLMATTTIQN